jgi:hypothetical protein
VSQSKYVAEVKSILSEQSEREGQEQQPPDTIQPIEEVDVYIEEDRITLIPKKPAQEQVIDSTPGTSSPQKPGYLHHFYLRISSSFDPHIADMACFTPANSDNNHHCQIKVSTSYRHSAIRTCHSSYNSHSITNSPDNR